MCVPACVSSCVFLHVCSCMCAPAFVFMHSCMCVPAGSSAKKREIKDGDLIRSNSGAGEGNVYFQGDFCPHLHFCHLCPSLAINLLAWPNQCPVPLRRSVFLPISHRQHSSATPTLSVSIHRSGGNHRQPDACKERTRRC